MEIKEMTIDDYNAASALWQKCDGIGLHFGDVDSKTWVALYLQRNPGMSFVAVDDERIVGAVLCGHEGRRGYMNHLAVAPDYRDRGVAKALVDKVTDKLRELGIRRCNAFVFDDNKPAIEFYKKTGWGVRDNLRVVSKEIVC